jgi:hypothetical protein
MIVRDTHVSLQRVHVDVHFLCAFYFRFLIFFDSYPHQPEPMGNAQEIPMSRRKCTRSPYAMCRSRCGACDLIQVRTVLLGDYGRLISALSVLVN